jgi:cytochrome P450
MSIDDTGLVAAEAGFDHLDPDYQADPFPILKDFRERCPVSHSDQYGGFWLLTQYDDIERVVHDYEGFSNRCVMIPRDLLIGFDGEPFSAPPLTSDPPYHSKFRRMLLPLFSPGQIQKWEDTTVEMAERLAIGLAGRSEVDMADEYAKHIPITVIARMMGVAEADSELFTDWIHRLFVNGPGDLDSSAGAMIEMYQYLYAQIEDRRENPGEDLISLLMGIEIDGEQLDENELLGGMIILLLAGIDTTWSSIGSAIHHLATHDDDRRRLVIALKEADDELWGSAVEEFLRCFAPVTIARVATKDSQVGNQQISEGEMILVPYVSGNHDPNAFDRPDDVIIDRVENRHLAFGLGIHRCLGSNLARLELRIALQTLLRHFPEFSVASGGQVSYGGGQVRGPRVLPVILSSKVEPLGVA